MTSEFSSPGQDNMCSGFLLTYQRKQVSQAMQKARSRSSCPWLEFFIDNLIVEIEKR